MSQSLKIDNLPFLPQNWISPPKLIRGPPQYQQGAFFTEKHSLAFRGRHTDVFEEERAASVKKPGFFEFSTAAGFKAAMCPL